MEISSQWWKHSSGAAAGGNRFVSAPHAREAEAFVLRWRTAQFSDNWFHSAPALVNDRLMFAAEHSAKALNICSGRPIWTVDGPSLSSTAADGDLVLLGQRAVVISTGDTYRDLSPLIADSSVKFPISPTLFNGSLYCCALNRRSKQELFIIAGLEGGDCQFFPENGTTMCWDLLRERAVGIYTDDRSIWSSKSIRSGGIAWSYRLDRLGESEFSGGPMPVVVVDEVFVSTGIDGFVVLDADSGAVKYRGEGRAVRDVRHGGGKDPGNVIVTPDRVVLSYIAYPSGKITHETPEGDQIFIAGYERGTGKFMWRTRVTPQPPFVCVSGDWLFGTEEAGYESSFPRAWRVSDGTEVWRSDVDVGNVSFIIAGGEYVVYINNYRDIFCFGPATKTKARSPRKAKPK